MVIVELQLEESVYMRLRTLAFMRGETVTGLMIGDAYRLSRIPTVSDDLVRMWTQGLTDGQIGSQLGWTNEKVARTRRAHHLQANKTTKSRSK